MANEDTGSIAEKVSGIVNNKKVECKKSNCNDITHDNFSMKVI